MTSVNSALFNHQMSNNMATLIASPKWFTLDHKIAFFFPL
ncbi:tryptophanase leader peptide [Aeromonas tecta]|nr:tryptophanase leader peptide [Aeromonas tecta]